MDDGRIAPELLDLVYGAALGQNTWQDILAALERPFPGVRFALWGHDLRSNRNLGLVYQGLDPAFMDPWLDYYSTINAWAPGLGRAPIGVPQYAEQLLPRDELVTTEYYNDWVKPQEDILTGVGLTMYSDADRFFTLSSNISARDEDRHKTALALLLKELGPHLARAFALTRAIQQSIAPQEFETAIELIGTAALLLDSRGRVVAGNAMARLLLDEQSIMEVDALARLRFSSALAQQRMDRLLLRLTGADQSLLSDTIAIEDDVTGGRFSLRIVPFRSAAVETDPGAAFAAPDRPVLLVCIEAELPDPEQRAGRMLVERFRLSPAECDLALGMCRGEQPGEIAERRQVSIHTVRNQLRSIFSKTDVGSQSQLVALVWRLVRRGS